MPLKSKITALAIFAVMLATGTASAKSPKFSADLDLKAADDHVDVIVQYEKNPDGKSTAIARAAGATLKRRLPLIRAMGYTLPRRAVEALLKNDSSIRYISPDREVQGSLDYAGVAVGADVARLLGYDGTGVGVAVIDSGVTESRDLKFVGSDRYRIVYKQNFVEGSSTSDDLYQHGTHVAGIIAGNGSTSTCSSCTATFRGVAPNARIINLRVLNSNGAGTDSAVIAAIQRAIELKDAYRIRVINLSLGRGVFESYKNDPLCQAVEAAWKAGIVVVVAAGNHGRDNSSGNQGYATITSPGIDPYVITVGAMRTMATATRSDDLIASYSSKGPTLLDHVVKPDIVAPGNRLISLLSSDSSTANLYPENLIPLSYYRLTSSDDNSHTYYRLSGTSMAAPMVSGAVALMLQKEPTLTPDQVKARLMKTASKAFPALSDYIDPLTGTTYTMQYDIFTVGAGYLDIAAALSSTDLAPAEVGSAKSPTAVYKDGNVYLVFDSSGEGKPVWDTSVMWGTSVVWGTSVLWGTDLSGSSVLWGASVCWGSDTSSGFSTIWGTSVLWGTSNQADAMSIAILGDN